MPIELFGLAGFPLVVARGLLLTAGAILWTLIFVRIVGLRAFSKMTAFDFVATVATASLIGQAAAQSDWFDYAQILAAIFAVFVVQWLLARLLILSSAAADVIRNEPLLLMRNGEFLEEAMRGSRVSRASLLEKIRASNVGNLDSVRAVVLETTGEISVLSGATIDPRLMRGVRGWPPDGKGVAADGDDTSQSG